MTSLTMLAEVVDVVIGVDTHVSTHSAALVAAGTGGVVEDLTVAADRPGLRRASDWADDMAEEHGALRAWAIEGTGSHGAGLARSPARTRASWSSSWTAPSGPSDATGPSPTRSTRSAPPGRPCPGPGWAPRAQAATGRPCRCYSPPAAPRSTAAGVAQRQLFSLIVAAPEVLRARFRGATGARPKVKTAAPSQRIEHPHWDTETDHHRDRAEDPEPADPTTA